MTLSILLAGESELEDFQDSCLEYGYKISDFELSTTNTTKETNCIHPVTGTITITHKKSKKQKTYKVGHMSKWPSEFDLDLKNGYFE
jgi:hypothetical protein